MIRRMLGTRLETLTLCFLLLPVFLFVAGWIKSIYSITLLAGLVVILVRHFKDPIESKGIEIEWKFFILLFVLAFAWVFFSGIGGFTYQNGDWKKHYAVLWDLVHRDWPVVMPDQTVPSGKSFLIYYFGYYLTPSIVGKIFGWKFMTAFLMFYTTLGITLGFYWIRVLTGIKSLLLVFMFTWTSGLDILGWLYFEKNWPGFQQHLEWWNGLHMQYPSTTNLLFWVPQHALAAWLGIPFVLHSLQKQKFLLATLGVIALPLWSPFICVGLAPFVLWGIWRARPIPWKQLIFPIVLVLSFGFVWYSYFNASMESFGLFLSTFRYKNHGQIWGVLLFHALEHLVFFGLIFWCWWKNLRKKDPVMIGIAMLCLLLIPLGESRLWNDWVMRVSVPSLYLMFLWFLTAMFEEQRRSLKYTIMAILIVIGSITPFKEYERSMDWFSSTRRELYPVRSMMHEFYLPTFKPQYFSNGDDFFHENISSHYER